MKKANDKEAKDKQTEETYLPLDAALSNSIEAPLEELAAVEESSAFSSNPYSPVTKVIDKIKKVSDGVSSDNLGGQVVIRRQQHLLPKSGMAYALHFS